jgi:hypothetical protein
MADGMVMRLAVPILTVWLAALGSAFCQSMRGALPDAPSAMAATNGVRLNQNPLPTSISMKTAWPVTSGLRPQQTLPPRPTFVFETVHTQRETGTFLKRYFDTPFEKQETRYQASSKNNFLGRATDAAARMFVTRDEMGKRRINTSYVVGVLTSVAAHKASRPYWARSNSVPIGDVGSTFGNDAGINLMHEFGPGLRQAVAGRMPSFVFRVEKRIVRNVNPPPTVPGPR